MAWMVMERVGLDVVASLVEAMVRWMPCFGYSPMIPSRGEVSDTIFFMVESLYSLSLGSDCTG